jgi:hypothetical protein
LARTEISFSFVSQEPIEEGFGDSIGRGGNFFKERGSAIENAAGWRK